MSNPTPKKRGRPAMPSDERRFRAIAKACGVSPETALRYIRTGTGHPVTTLQLARLLGLTHDEIIYGTNKCGTSHRLPRLSRTPAQEKSAKAQRVRSRNSRLLDAALF